MLGAQPLGGFGQVLARDVHRHEAHRPLQRREQQAHLAAGAGAELDDLRVRADALGQLRRMAVQQGQLGARRVVLGQLADAPEEPRTGLVVEPLGRHCAWPARAGRPAARRRRGRAQTSRASRRPLNYSAPPAGRNCSCAARGPAAWPLEPRSTIWPTMNLPLYSPTAPAHGGKRGRVVGRARPLPGQAEALRRRHSRRPRPPTRTRSATVRRPIRHTPRLRRSSGAAPVPTPRGRLADAARRRCRRRASRPGPGPALRLHHRPAIRQPQRRVCGSRRRRRRPGTRRW